MSAYYVIGSNSKIEDIDKLNLGFQKIDNIERYINHIGFEKKYYYVSDPIGNEIGYNITNYANFYDNEKKKNFMKFIDFIKANLNDELEFYKFWSVFDRSDNEINNIYYQNTYNLNEYVFPDDKFEFDFQTKYVFIKS